MWHAGFVHSDWFPSFGLVLIYLSDFINIWWYLLANEVVFSFIWFTLEFIYSWAWFHRTNKPNFINELLIPISSKWFRLSRTRNSTSDPPKTSLPLVLFTKCTPMCNVACEHTEYWMKLSLFLLLNRSQ